MPHLPRQVAIIPLETQPHSLGLTAWQVSGSEQVLPQATGMLQLSLSMPHLPMQVTAMGLEVQPHWLGTPPPPHTWGDGQPMPQSTSTLQLFLTRPHLPPLQVLD